MRLPFLQFLLVDCSRVGAEDWFYKIGCFVSSLTLINSLVALASFCVDYYSHSPIYHSLPLFWQFLLYTMCLMFAVVAGVPQLLVSLTAALGINCADRGCLARLTRMARIENFYHRGSFSRYLFLATLTTASVILCNMTSVLALYHGVSSLFELHWTDDHFKLHSEASIDAVQQHYQCCGLEGFADWLKMVGRVPGSCASASTIDARRSNDSSVKLGLERRNRSATLLRLHGRGCLSPLTSEQAIVCGIGNMLAFAGVLLLVAAWTRVERLAEVTVAQLKSTTFNHPRHFNDAAAFLEQRKMRQANRFAVYSSSGGGTDRGRSESSETPGHARRVFADHQVKMSDGFLHLHLHDDGATAAREGPDTLVGDLAHGGRRNNDIGEGSNSNNSALASTGSWRSARILNSVDRREALRRAWELQGCCHRRCCGLADDSVQLVNEQPLDARRLLDGSGISHRRRQLTQRVAVGFVTQDAPLLLEDVLSSWHCGPGVPPTEPPFCTAASGRFPQPAER